jgi:hypothetical protein
MRGYPAVPAVPAKLPEHKVVAQAQVARDQIRALLPKLPAEEAEIFQSVLDMSERNIEIKRENELLSVFPWDRVAAEIKNMIYKLLFVHENEPISPIVSYPGVREKESKRKYDLAGHFLRTCQSIRDEALPILLGQNTFEFNRHMYSYLGVDKNSREHRGTMVRKIVIHADSRENEFRCLSMLNCLEEITIVSPAVVRGGADVSQPADADLCQLAWEEFYMFRPYSRHIDNLIKGNPGASIHFLHEFLNSTANGIVAIRIEIFWDEDRKDFARGDSWTNEYSLDEDRWMPLV